tara:strand:+ start:558 stop:764 length:207 start_codon:yes stop_codon:yes gene_type:complete
MKKLVNGIIVNMTAEEIAQREQDIVQAEQIKNTREQAKLDKETANQSAIDKLKALGLTDAEIEAFRGN